MRTTAARAINELVCAACIQCVLLLVLCVLSACAMCKGYSREQMYARDLMQRHCGWLQWRRNMFQLAITFHGGMQAIAYE